MIKKIMKFICVMLLALLASGYAQAATVTIAPTDTQIVENCYPFGGGGNGWTPYMGFIYQNIPPFNLHPGDTLAFDLGVQNDTDIQMEIAMARTVANGSDIDAEPFTTIVSNTQTPENPRGDAIIGNYELRFTVEQPFSFPGGGLIIRFSNPSAAFSADTSCDQVLVTATTSDASGYFVERFFRDDNGTGPWDEGGTDAIGGFQITTRAFSVPSLTQWGMIFFVVLAGLGSVSYMRRRRRTEN